MDLNTEFLIRKKRLKIADEQLAVAKNQRLVQLDFKGFYGLNGVTNTPSGSFGMIDSIRYPSWSFGLELHIPLEGGIKTKASAKRVFQEYTDLHLEIGIKAMSGIADKGEKIRHYQW